MLPARLLRSPVGDGVLRRGFHSSLVGSRSLIDRVMGTGDIFKYDMLSPPPYAPVPKARAPVTATPVEISEMPNGVFVGSQDFGGQASAMSIFVDACPRYENPATTGSSFMLEKMAFAGSANMSKPRMIRDMEDTACMFTCAASRESIVSCTEGLRLKVPQLFRLLAESAINPAGMLDPTSGEGEMAKQDFADSVERVKKDLKVIRSDPVKLMSDDRHAASYTGNCVGNPLLIDDHRLGTIQFEDIHEFVTTMYTGSNIVVTGCNVDHAELVQLVDETMGHLPKGERNLPKFPARYTGGEIRTRAEGPTYFSIGFEGYSWEDPELVPQCILQLLLGGGGSFSPGGPGKGLFTKLYSDVLYKNHWVHSTQSVMEMYADTAILAIEGSADPPMAKDLMHVISEAAENLDQEPTQAELSRAKNQAKSALLMPLENRLVVCEDIGRQLLYSRKYITPSEFINRIENVTTKDMQKVGRKLLSSRPSIVLRGELFDLSSYELLKEKLQKRLS